MGPEFNELINYYCPVCKKLKPKVLYKKGSFIEGCEYCLHPIDAADYLTELENEKPFYDVSEAVDFMDGRLD